MAIDPTALSLEFCDYVSGAAYGKGKVVLSSGISYYSLKDNNLDALTDTNSWLRMATSPAGSSVSSLLNSDGGSGQLLYSTDTEIIALNRGPDDTNVFAQDDQTIAWEASTANREEYSDIQTLPMNDPCQLFGDTQADEPILAYINTAGQVLARGWGRIGIFGKTASKIYQEKGTIAVITSDDELWLYTNNSAYATSSNHNKWHLSRTHVKEVYFFHPNYGTRNTDTPSDLAILRTTGTDNANVSVADGEIYYIGSNSTNFSTHGTVTDYTKVGDADGFDRLVIGKNNRSFYGIKTNGDLFVWGVNTTGELGMGTEAGGTVTNNFTNITNPTQNTNLVDVDLLTTTGSPNGTGACVVLCSAKRTANAAETNRHVFVFGDNGGSQGETANYQALFGESPHASSSYPQEPAVSLYLDPTALAGSNSHNAPAFALIQSNRLYVIGGNNSSALATGTNEVDMFTEVVDYDTPSNYPSGGADISTVGIDQVIFIGGYNTTDTREETAIIFHSNGQLFGQGFNVDDIITQSYDTNAAIDHITYIVGVGEHTVTKLFNVYGGTESQLMFLDSDGQAYQNNTFTKNTENQFSSTGEITISMYEKLRT